MRLKRKKVDSEQEQNLLTGLIVSDRFAREIIPILHIRNLRASYSRRVARWCIDYYNKYKKSPKEVIQDIYSTKVREDDLPEEEKELISTFLTNLSKKYEKQDLKRFNDEFLIRTSEDYITERKLEVLFESGKSHLALGKVDDVETLISSYVRERRPESTSVDLINNKDIISYALHDDLEALIRFPGALGDIIGDILRGDFFAFMGPMKRGKTWWLEDFAIRSLMRRLKVLYISLEMPLNQVIRRFYQNFMGLPKKPKEIAIPYFTEEGSVGLEIKKKPGLRTTKISKMINAVSMMSKGGGIRVLTRPSKSMTVEDVRTEVYSHAHYEKFYPDVVIVDYADILAPERNSPLDVRHRIDETWARLRGLAQEINGVVVTATQSSRATFKKDIEEEDTSEDIRKLAHVTHMAVLNQTRQEKKDYIIRIGMLAAREEEFQFDDEAVVLYQYGIGKACIDSRFRRDVDY